MQTTPARAISAPSSTGSEDRPGVDASPPRKIPETPRNVSSGRLPIPVSPGTGPGTLLERLGGLPGTVGSIAWRLPSPIFPDSELSAAWDHLERTACTIVPVMGRNGQYVGVVRRGDLVRLNPGGGMHRPEAAGRGRLEERNVRELLSRFPFGVDRRAPISAAKQAMDDAAVGCVPVVDGVRLVGFVTSVEVLRSYMGTDASADAT